jgi:hypothetical protein
LSNRQKMMLVIDRCLLSYVLEDPCERVRLRIAFVPTLWPALCVRAPVPWHCANVRARHALAYRYYHGNPVLLELRRIWQDRFLLSFLNNGSHKFNVTKIKFKIVYSVSSIHMGNIYIYTHALSPKG